MHTKKFNLYLIHFVTIFCCSVINTEFSEFDFSTIT